MPKSTVLVLLGLLLCLPPSLLAQPVVDQSQPVIEDPGFAWAIGGFSLARVAQVVTSGIAGPLAAVRLPIGCADDHSGYLVVEVQGVTATGEPDGVVLTSQSVLGASLPPFFPAAPVLRDITFTAPATFAAGQQFAIVLSTAESCGVFPGPVGDPYAGGDGFGAGLPGDLDSWNSFCTNPRGRCDLPFQTLVGDPPVCTSSVTTIAGLRSEIASLATSATTLATLDGHLDRVENALARGRNDRARRRLERIIREAVNQSNLAPSDPDHIPLDAANHLVCSASNVLSGIPLP